MSARVAPPLAKFKYPQRSVPHNRQLSSLTALELMAMVEANGFAPTHEELSVCVEEASNPYYMLYSEYLTLYICLSIIPLSINPLSIDLSTELFYGIYLWYLFSDEVAMAEANSYAPTPEELALCEQAVKYYPYVISSGTSSEYMSVSICLSIYPMMAEHTFGFELKIGELIYGMYIWYVFSDERLGEWYISEGEASQQEMEPPMPIMPYNRKNQGNMYNICYYANTF